MAKAARVLKRMYPRSFIVHLVFCGIHGYSETGYWPAVRETTGLDLSPPQRSHWGRLFKNITQSLDLARFIGLDGHRFVGLILAHGGIPRYCLPDFFEQIIRPFISRPEYAILSAAEFIVERLRQTSIPTRIDKPVLRVGIARRRILLSVVVN